MSTDRPVSELAITPLCHGGVRGSIPLRAARRFIMDWKKNEVKILRNFACPECKVTVVLDNEVRRKNYNGHCPRCKREFLISIIVADLSEMP